MPPIITANLDNFMVLYEKHLHAAVSEVGSPYCYPPDRVPHVAAKMRAAIEAGCYNKDGEGFKRTCKELKIPHTYKGILAHLSQT